MTNLEIALACGACFLVGTLFAMVVLDVVIYTPLKNAYLAQRDLAEKAIGVLKNVRDQLENASKGPNGSVVSPIQIHEI